MFRGPQSDTAVIIITVRSAGRISQARGGSKEHIYPRLLSFCRDRVLTIFFRIFAFFSFFLFFEEVPTSLKLNEIFPNSLSSFTLSPV